MTVRPAAPLILLAQTRQANRDKVIAQTDTDHREQLATTTLDHQRLLYEQVDHTHQLLAAIDARLDELAQLISRIHDRTHP